MKTTGGKRESKEPVIQYALLTIGGFFRRMLENSETTVSGQPGQTTGRITARRESRKFGYLRVA